MTKIASLEATGGELKAFGAHRYLLVIPAFEQLGT